MTYTKIIPLSGWEQQIILGTVLGGSSLIKSKHGKNCYLSMRDKNYYWLNYKSQEIKLSSQHSFFYDKKTIRWHSIASPALNEIYDYFYINNHKTVTNLILDKLRDIGLMVWFMDSGGIENELAFFRTTRYGEEGTEIINKYFKLLDLNSHIVKNSRGKKVILDKPSTIRLIKVISPVAPEFMYGSLVIQ